MIKKQSEHFTKKMAIKLQAMAYKENWLMFGIAKVQLKQVISHVTVKRRNYTCTLG